MINGEIVRRTNCNSEVLKGTFGIIEKGPYQGSLITGFPIDLIDVRINGNVIEGERTSDWTSKVDSRAWGWDSSE